MATTTSFKLQISQELKEAATSLVGLDLIEWGEYETISWSAQVGSLHLACTMLMYMGLPRILNIIDSNITSQWDGAAIAQDIMLFLVNNPAAQKAYAVNFDLESAARRVIDACDAEFREAAENDENDRGINGARSLLSEAEEEIFHLVVASPEQGDGIGRQIASDILNETQDRRSRLLSAKGALERALATHGGDWNSPPS